MGYIPAPSRGALDVQASRPDAKPGRVWLDTDTGGMERFNEQMGEWQPVFEADPFAGGKFRALAIGRAPIGAAFSLAIGHVVGETNTGAVAIGTSFMGPTGGASALGPGGVAIGADARAGGSSGAGVIAIGQGPTVADGGTSHAIALGTSVTIADGSANAVVIGSFASTDGGGPNAVVVGTGGAGRGQNPIVIGNQAQTATGATNAVAVGVTAFADGSNPVAVGGGAQATDDGTVAVGVGAQASAVNAVAVGGSSSASHSNSVAVGVGATTSADNRASVSPHELELGANGGAPQETALIMTSANGTRYRVTVSNAGALTVAPV